MEKSGVKKKGEEKIKEKDTISGASGKKKKVKKILKEMREVRNTGRRRKDKENGTKKITPN